MAIDGCGVDEPFYFSSAGAADEASIQHDGSDLLINNDTGMSKIGNGSVYQFVFDHTNLRLGIGALTPAYKLHVYHETDNAVIGAERSGGATTYINATTTNGNFGTIGAFPARIITNSIARVAVDTSGNVTIPAAYTTVISGVNTDLYIDSTGLIGPNPSSVRFKENVRELEESDTKWIFQVPIKKYDMKSARGGEKDKIGVIAEEVEPINKKVVRYAAHEVTENGPILLNGSEYDLLETGELLPGIESENLPVYKKLTDVNGDDTKIKEWKRLILLPISVNLTDFIIPMLKEIQELRREVDILKNG